MTPDLLASWLCRDVLPLWSAYGVDQQAGGFFELLSHDLSEIPRPRRARLTARQIYSFAAGAELGWDGPVDELIDHGLDFLRNFLVSDDGRVISSVLPDGSIVHRGPDLYDDAFVLFALASVARRRGDASKIETLARRIADRMIETRGSIDGAFSDTDDKYLANPMMHLVEAFLEWVEVTSDCSGFWYVQASTLIDIALRRMIQPESNVIPEVFDQNWRPLPDSLGLLVEPGHQFEWGWLLARWSAITGMIHPLEQAMRIATTAEIHGMNYDGITFEAMNERYQLRDASARLWPQAERAKFWHTIHHHPLAKAEHKVDALAKRDAALSALATFWDDTRPGLWREVRLTTGNFVEEPVRASSLYHIICAAVTVSRPWINRKSDHARDQT